MPFKEAVILLKVLYVLNHAGKAGTERYVESLIAGLDKKKIKAYFVYNEEGLLADKLKGMGVETFRIAMRSRFDLKAAREISVLCRKLSIDLIHAQFLRENYIALLSRIFNPAVKVMYTNHFILANDFVTRLSNRLLTLLESRIIAVCNRGKEMLVRNGMSGKKIEVLFNAVDPAYWRQPMESTLRDEFGIQEEDVVLLCASRFAHDKGHAYLVNGLAELVKIAGKPFKCVLAGDGPLLDDVKAQVRGLGLEDKVVFTGFRSDIKNLFYGSDIYINSSEHEALSFLILEALASGLPLIATDMGGNSDIVNEDTGCGILVKYGNAAELAEAVNRLMNDEKLRMELRENAYKAVDGRFNLDKMVEKTYNLYEHACKNAERNEEKAL